MTKLLIASAGRRYGPYRRTWLYPTTLVALLVLAPGAGAQASSEDTTRPVLAVDDVRKQLALVELERSRLALSLQGFDIGGAAGLTGSGYRSEAPEPWAQQDPADSLYREARRSLSAEQYDRAATLFRRIRSSFPGSSYAPDAPYWEAFALQRMGGETNKTAALEVLAFQLNKYPTAATRGDALSLRNRIERSLGRSNDSIGRAVVSRAITSATKDGCPTARDDERIDALAAVVRLDSANALPVLRKTLARREACTQQLRRTAVWLTASLNQPGSTDLLLEVLRSDPDAGVREQAVLWLMNIDTDASRRALIAAARNSSGDIAVRKRAVYALSRSSSPAAQSALVDILRDPKTDDDLRNEALVWYMNSDYATTGKDNAERMSLLRDLFARSSGSSDRLRSSLLWSMASSGDAQSLSLLVRTALDKAESMSLRRNAVGMLAASVQAGGASLFYLDRDAANLARYSMIDQFRSASEAARVAQMAAELQSKALSAYFPATPPLPPAPITPMLSVPGNVTLFGRSASPADSAARVERIPYVAGALISIYDGSTETELKRSVISALLQLPNNRGIDRLIEVVRKEKDPELRRMLIAVLSQSRDPRVLSVLREVIDRD